MTADASYDRRSLRVENFFKDMLARRKDRIYILPTWYCLLFNVLLLLVMGFGYAVQNAATVGAGLLLLFIELLSMIEAHVNLRELSLFEPQPSSADEFSNSTMMVRATSQSQSFGIQFYCVDDADVQSRRHWTMFLRTLSPYMKDEISKALFGFKRQSNEVDGNTITIESPPKTISLKFSTKSRGVYRAPNVVAVSMFPFGMFRVWREYRFSECYAAFPRPVGAIFPADNAGVLDGRSSEGYVEQRYHRVESFEYSHHRKYLAGDNLRRIDWRASSRLSENVVRVFSGIEGNDVRIFRWANVRSLHGEAKIGQLSLWVRQAFTDRQSFGLEIPGVKTPIGSSARHLEYCLSVLADFDLQKTAPGGRL